MTTDNLPQQRVMPTLRIADYSSSVRRSSVSRWTRPSSSCVYGASIPALAAARLADIESKMQQLIAMRRALQHMLSAWCGDGALECPILEALEQDRDV